MLGSWWQVHSCAAIPLTTSSPVPCCQLLESGGCSPDLSTPPPPPPWWRSSCRTSRGWCHVPLSWAAFLSPAEGCSVSQSISQTCRSCKPPLVEGCPMEAPPKQCEGSSVPRTYQLCCKHPWLYWQHPAVFWSCTLHKNMSIPKQMWGPNVTCQGFLLGCSFQPVQISAQPEIKQYPLIGTDRHRFLAQGEKRIPHSELACRQHEGHRGDWDALIWKSLA